MFKTISESDTFSILNIMIKLRPSPYQPLETIVKEIRKYDILKIIKIINRKY